MQTGLGRKEIETPPPRERGALPGSVGGTAVVKCLARCPLDPRSLSRVGERDAWWSPGREPGPAHWIQGSAVSPSIPIGRELWGRKTKRRKAAAHFPRPRERRHRGLRRPHWAGLQLPPRALGWCRLVMRGGWFSAQAAPCVADSNARIARQAIRRAKIQKWV